MPIFNQEIYYFEMDNKDCFNCVLYQIKSLPLKRTSNNSPKIRIQYKLIGKANRYFYIDPNDGFIYNNQTLPINDSSKNRLFKLIVQSYYAFENGRPINNLKSTSTLLIVVRRFKNELPKESFDSFFSNQLIELDKYQFGEVIYRLPIKNNVKYEISDLSFALKNRNQIIILKRPKRIETVLKVKRVLQNQTDYIELNIRFAQQKQDTYQIFRRKLFNVQLNENSTVGQKVIELKANGHLNYTFSIYKGNHLGHFNLDQSNGILYLANKLNCKLFDHYTLIVLATNGLKSNFAVVHIQIEIPNPHLTLPILPLNHYQAVINENIPIGSKIIKIMEGNNSTLDGYKFVVLRNNQIGNQKLPFEFDPKTGYLISTSTVDYEQLFDDSNNILNLKFGQQFTNLNSYSKQFHNGSSSLKSLDEQVLYSSIYLSPSNYLLNEISIKIKVNSEDEFYPKFEKNLYEFKLEIQQNESVFVIGQVHAEDADKGEDGEIIYSINSTVPNWTKDLFNLNENTGIITMNLVGNDLLMSNAINNWLQSPSAYTSIIVLAKSSKANSLSSVTVVDINLQTKIANHQSKVKLDQQSSTKNFEKSLLKQPSVFNNKIHTKIQNTMNKNILTSYESNEINQSKSQQSSINKQNSIPSSQTNIARNINESYNGQRKLIPSNLIQVYGIVIGLLALLIILILFSVILLFRICNFTRKDNTSSNNSIYNSKNQDYDPNPQLTKSISCLINGQNFSTNQSDSTIIIGQHNKLKQADFIVNMAMQRNSIIYQEQQHKTNNGYLNSNASLINDTSSNCNTSITILHSHENSETKSDCLNSDLSINHENNPRTEIGHLSTKITNLQNRSLPPVENKKIANQQRNVNKMNNNGNISNQNRNKNRPLPDIANPQQDLPLTGNQEVKYSSYDEVREPTSYYSSNYLDSTYNHNYEAISPTYDQVEFFQNWSPAYPSVTEVLNEMVKNRSQIESNVKSNLKEFNEQKRNFIKTANLINTNKLN